MKIISIVLLALCTPLIFSQYVDSVPEDKYPYQTKQGAAYAKYVFDKI